MRPGTSKETANMPNSGGPQHPPASFYDDEDLIIPDDLSNNSFKE